FQHVDVHRRHVQHGRNEVVGERRVADLPARGLDLLHDRQAQPLRGPTLDLAEHGLRIHGLADVLGTVERDDLDEPEIRVDVDDGTVGGEAVLHVRGSLSGFPVDRLGRAVSPLDGLVEYLVTEYLCGIGEYRPVPAGNGLAGRDLDVRLAVRGERARVPGNPVDQITTHRVTGGPNGPAGHISLSGGRGGTTITDAGVHRLHGHSLQSQF